jgi:nucleoside-diphosphate-sugar epimerase
VKIFMTGASGYIGCTVAAALLKAGHAASSAATAW